MSSHRFSARVAAAAMLAVSSAAAACVPDTASSGWTVTDSAGVTLAESHAPAWDEATRWTVDPEPALDLSTSGTGLGHQFYRVADADRLNDGRIVVADGGLARIRVFDADGGLLAEMGGEGQGPGEFRQLAQVWHAGSDTVVAFDQTGRITRFLASGQLLDTREMARPDPSPWAQLARLADGSFVGATGWTAAQLPQGEGRLRAPSPVIRVVPGAQLLDTLFSLPGTEAFRVGEGRQAVVGLPLVGRFPVVRIRGEELVAGSGDGLAYQVRSLAGTLQEVVRVPGFDLSGADSLQAALVADRLATVTDETQRAGFAELLSRVPPPDQRPGHSDLQVDPDGNVWAAEHRGPVFMYPPGSWQVFDPDGRWLGRVDMPERFRALRVGRDWVLGVHLDELDVQRVRLHVLTRGG